VVILKTLAEVKTHNSQMAREIQRNKMFNKKDEDRKKKKAEADDLAYKISDRNKVIEENDIKLD
jgi:hypothetical protein